MYRTDGRCSRCGRKRETEHRWCRKCQAAHKRVTRTHHRDLSPEARLRANARSYANVYQRRGKLPPQRCACGRPGVHKCHRDYTKPLEVIWTCETCYRALRQRQRNRARFGATYPT